MDEDGKEAAAATVVLMYPTSGPVIEPVPVTLDRPFIYRITDDTTGAALFIGQIQNPSAERPPAASLTARPQRLRVPAVADTRSRRSATG